LKLKDEKMQHAYAEREGEFNVEIQKCASGELDPCPITHWKESGNVHQITGWKSDG